MLRFIFSQNKQKKDRKRLGQKKKRSYSYIYKLFNNDMWHIPIERYVF